MLKLLNCILVLVIIGGVIQSINCETLQCEYEESRYFSSMLYSCSVTILENPNDNKIITGQNGVHMANKNDTDVKQIYISESNITYIPEGLGYIFNLTALVIRHSQLKELRSNDFQGMQDVHSLSLLGNKLASVPSDAFSTLIKLKFVSLSSNQIKFIGSGLFNGLIKLIRVDLAGNICVNEQYVGSSAIIQMKEDIIENCINTNDPYEIIIKLEQRNKELTKDKETMEKEKDSMKMEFELEFNNKITEINEMNEKNYKCNKDLTAANEQLFHLNDHDSANVGRRLK